MRNARGFTLSEPLVVIAIISVLAAILMPVFASQVHWSNALQPHIKNWGLHACPSAAAVRLNGVNYTVAPAARINYTYNGLLHGLSVATVAAPSTLPVFWEGRGKAAVEGFALTNPSLECTDLTRPCRYFSCLSGAIANAYPRGVMFGLNGTMWIHSQGAVFVLAAGSARWRRLGAQLAPNDTDWRTAPYTQYDSQGRPGNLWWDGCKMMEDLRADVGWTSTTGGVETPRRPQARDVRLQIRL